MGMPELATRKFNWFAATCAGLTLILTILTFSKATEHPPIYDIEIVNFYTNVKSDVEILSKKLNTGNYTMLAVKSMGINAPGGQGDKYTVLLGKIKK